MSRIRQLLFCVSLLALGWYATMAIHEFGHVIGTIVTGGSIERVVLHPLAISRTDVMPNPHPGIVVWLGPVVGCLLPLVLWAAVPRRFIVTRSIAQLFAGFCLIANGIYIALGSFDQVGDCREMLATGTPQWVMLVFGAITTPLGFYLWHNLGSLRAFLNEPTKVSPRLAYVVSGSLVFAVVAGLVFSSR